MAESNVTAAGKEQRMRKGQTQTRGLWMDAKLEGRERRHASMGARSHPRLARWRPGCEKRFDGRVKLSDRDEKGKREEEVVASAPFPWVVRRRQRKKYDVGWMGRSEVRRRGGAKPCGLLRGGLKYHLTHPQHRSTSPAAGTLLQALNQTKSTRTLLPRGVPRLLHDFVACIESSHCQFLPVGLAEYSL